MIRIRRADERGHADYGWLNTYHSFSFGSYYDPAQMGFQSLRVINEDRVQPGKGFGTHGHRDMEIISYVLNGALAHRDSMGHGSILRPGEIQRMSAGTGIEHSEFNPSETEPVHFYQIWIVPRRKGATPRYEQRAFPDTGKRNQLRLVLSENARDGSIEIDQDASIYLATLDPGHPLIHEIASKRHVWLQVLRGSVTLNEQSLGAGSAAAISDERRVEVQATEPAEMMLFDLA